MLSKGASSILGEVQPFARNFYIGNKLKSNSACGGFGELKVKHYCIADREDRSHQLQLVSVHCSMELIGMSESF